MRTADYAARGGHVRRRTCTIARAGATVKTRLTFPLSVPVSITAAVQGGPAHVPRRKDNVETGAMRQLPTSACTCTVPVLALCTKNEGAQQRCSDNLCAEFGISVRL